jgi:hypothetical protein
MSHFAMQLATVKMIRFDADFATGQNQVAK